MIVAAAGLACAIVFVAGLAPVSGQDKSEKKAPTRKDVKELMAKAHKGDNSTLASLQKELKAQTPDWARVVADVKSLHEMAEALRTGAPSVYIYHSEESLQRAAGSYADNVKALDRAAQARDSKAASAALAGLRGTCSACHGYTIP
jgi:cytochrome c556